MATSDTIYQSCVVSEQQGREKKSHCSKIRKIQSRGVFLVLLWTFAVNAVGYTVFRLAVTNYFQFWFPKGLYSHGIAAITVILLSCPLAGWLADVHFGRYKILKVSLWLMWISTAVLAILYTLSIIRNPPSAIIKTTSMIVVLPMGFSYAAFLANGIPFAMDQMPAASGEQVSALINWYIWASFLGEAVAQLGTIAYSDNNQRNLSETQIYMIIPTTSICGSCSISNTDHCY